ncbi:hypothetical protein K1719_035965 [Acacia pycnantha]|nr:hypothetical protein K1719_035965 [Acacia pycnantha]
MFWRSASWSAPRSAAHNPDGEEKDFVDLDGSVGNINGESRRYPPDPLTPRSQQNCKARSFCRRSDLFQLPGGAWTSGQKRVPMISVSGLIPQLLVEEVMERG